MNHACSCDEFVDEGGLGRCQKRDENFNGEFSCFVNESEGCTDVKTSTNYPGKHISTAPCADKNEGYITLYLHRTFDSLFNAKKLFVLCIGIKM